MLRISWISIHALCEEGDLVNVAVKQLQEFISIHALCEEGDMLRYCASCPVGKFLSTPSARRATSGSIGFTPPPSEFLSTPSARRATRPGNEKTWILEISIHALCEEGDSHDPRRIP